MTSFPNGGFDSLGLSAPILKALAAEGYATPTPIQAQAIPIVLSGADLIGLAQTGTGKTAAFALPIIDRLAANRRHAGARACRTLVLAPTRELASQIAASFRAYGRFIGLSTAVVFGGVSIGKQIHALERGVDILVATPGRLLDLIGQRACKLDALEILVLDEADHMLDMGFVHDIRRIAKLVPAKRQTLLFSATMPPAIAELAQTFLTDPQQVAVTPVASTAERVAQRVVHIDAAKKQDLLNDLLSDPSFTRALVFTRTKHGADRVVKRLAMAGIDAAAIHGNKSQGQRERALDAFRKGHARLLIATEIAARGIDIDDVTHVINFDLPDVPEQYVHRIGRTARAGAQGEAISFCAPDERGNLRDIERLIKQSVPVFEHELSLPAPQPGQRAPASKPRQQQRQQQRPQQHQQKRPQRPQKKTHVHADHARQEQKRSDQVRAEPKRDRRPHDARPHDARQHDAGDRRDRKGREVWSNAAPAPSKKQTRR
ncbi:MAG TPA: DEAD/DEAH box helicase [Caulobacterales bacterium]|nr:DEAD/DEAH box helicase [Caulobacterales bacterium]